MSAKSFIKGTFILTLAGVITRLLGFVFKIILSRLIGAEGIGTYQLIMPICGIMYAIGVSGFEVAILRLTARYHAAKRPDKALSVLMLSCIYSLIICTICCVIVSKNSLWIATHIFHNTEVSSLIKILVLSVPFSAIHCMVNSYFLGHEKTVFSGVSQLLEQIIRMLSVYFIIKITGKTDASIGVLSLVVGEIGAAIISVNYILFTLKARPDIKFRSLKIISTQIRKSAFFVSLNKLSLHILQSVGIILTPIMLVKSGMTSSDAIKTFGIITGMALPVILFPATLTNSVSVMLLPSVSKSRDNIAKIKKSASNALLFSLIFGFVCIIFLITFGALICQSAFNEAMLTDYIRVMAWLCPFIFVSTTFKSILNAMGKSSHVFANNMLSESIMIICILIFIPKIGINAYMFGLLTSQCANAILQLITFSRSINRLNGNN